MLQVLAPWSLESRPDRRETPIFNSLTGALIDVFDLAIGMACVPSLGSWEDGVIGRPWPATETGSLIVLEGLLYFGSGIHYEGPVLNHRFADRFSLEEEELGLCPA